MTGQQLKNSILQEAIQGHLIPQNNSSDEPAIKLLECIHKEKVELVKAGKLKKKDLEIEPILAEEYPFEKPSGWEFARLSDISLDSADGPFGSNLKKEHYTSQKQVRIIQLSNIGELGWRDANVKYTTFEHLKTVSRSEAFAGDIIIAKMMPAGRAIICPNADTKYVLSSDAVRFAFSTLLDRRYLYYAINSPVFKDQVYGEVQGITRVRTSLSKLRTYILPIPPLSEQKRIVEKIDELLPLVDEYEKAAGELETLNKVLPEKLRKSVLQEAIHGTLVANDIPEGEATATELLQQILKERQKIENKEKGSKAKKIALSTIEEEPWELPEGWCWARLGDVMTFVNGRAYKKDELLSSGKYKVLRVGNFFTNDSWYYSDLELPEEKYCFNGDLLYAWSASFGPWIWEGDKTIFHYHIWNVKFNDCWLYKKYLYWFFEADKHIIKESTTGSTMVHVSMENMMPRMIPIPPLSIQHRIVEKIEEVFSTIDKLC